jgi:hypothetical protein
MNREPLLHVLAIAETCRSGNLLVINLFVKSFLLLSVLQRTISDKANTVVGFHPCLLIVWYVAQFYKKLCVGIIFTLHTDAPGFWKHSFS